MNIFEQLFEHCHVAMILINQQGQVVLVNKHTEHLFQYKRAELVGSKIEVLLPQVSQVRHPEFVKEYLNPPLSRQMGVGRVLFGVRKDQTQFPIEVGLNPIENNGETFVLSSILDMTERHRAEERFRGAVDAAPSGMLMIGSDRKIILINRKIEEIFGYMRDELIGNPIEILVPDSFKGPHPKFVDSYIHKPAPRAMGIGRELFGKHKSGKLIPVEIGLQPITTSHGETFVISSVVDITFRRNAEAEIKRKTEEIEEFAYRTSHDLRSPLKSISAMAECLTESLEEENLEEAHLNVAKIKQLSERLLTLIEDILTLTRVDLGNEATERFDFEDYGRGCKEKFTALLKDSGVEFQESYMHKKPLLTQKTRLTQILDNLITNSLKYSDAKKEKRYVRLSTFNDSTRFFIHVEDNGLGIPKERQTEVFGMFKRFHTGGITGSGLGLYLIKKQMTRLGAEVSFESGEGGTTFYLEFKDQTAGVVSG